MGVKLITRQQLGGFIDLLYVAAMLNLNDLFNECDRFNHDVLFYSVGIYFILFTTRYHFDTYAIMLYATDPLHRIFYTIIILGICIMIFNIIPTSHETVEKDTDDHGSSSSNGFTCGDCTISQESITGFAAGFIISRISLIGMYSFGAYSSRVRQRTDQFAFFMIKLTPLVIGAIIMMTNLGPSTTKSPFLIISIVTSIEVVGDVLPALVLFTLKRLKIKWELLLAASHVRPDVLEMMDRLQGFFLIVSGEAVIGLLTFRVDTNKIHNLYFTLIFSVLVIYGFSTSFLSTVHRTINAGHVMKCNKNLLKKMVYVWLHPVSCYCLLLSLNSLYQLTKFAGASDTYNIRESERHARYTLSLSLFIVILMFLVMRMTHKGFKARLRNKNLLFSDVFKILLGLLHYLFYHIINDSRYLIMAHALLITLTNNIDFLINAYSEYGVKELILFVIKDPISKDEDDQEEDEDEDEDEEMKKNHAMRISISFRDIYPRSSTVPQQQQQQQQNQGPMIEMNTVSNVLNEIALLPSSSSEKKKHDDDGVVVTNTSILPYEKQDSIIILQEYDHHESTIVIADDDADGDGAVLEENNV